MLTKENVRSTLTFIIFLYVSDASAMLTRLRPLTRTNKVHLRNYSTKEPKDLRKLAAQQFVLKDPLSIATMYTLLQHHKDKKDNLLGGASFAGFGLTIGTIPIVSEFIVSAIINDSMLYPNLIFPSILVSTLSVASLCALTEPLNKRTEIVEKLEKAFSTGEIVFANINHIQSVTQEDIAAKMKYLQIIPTKDISHFGKQDEALQYKWDINDPEILKNTLDGKYNSSDYILYLQDKE